MMQVEQTADGAEDFGHLIDFLCNLVEYETGCLHISHGMRRLRINCCISIDVDHHISADLTIADATLSSA
jgi:hypothetical protein